MLALLCLCQPPAIQATSQLALATCRYESRFNPLPYRVLLVKRILPAPIQSPIMLFACCQHLNLVTVSLPFVAA